MILNEIVDILEAEVVVGDASKVVIENACACDLLSNVLGCVRSKNAILLTNLTNSQTVRVAEMVDAVAVCFLRMKKPQEEAIELAQKKGIVLLSTRFTNYEASGLLYQSGLPGCTYNKEKLKHESQASSP